MSRLLLVEDDNSVRTTVSTFLELEGYAVDAVSSTREALSRLQAEAYPIVISDIYLDERTGLDVLQTARTKVPKCAVILMTGRGSMETVMAATRGGAFDYIAKPFELDRMLDTVKRAEASLDPPDDDSTEINDLPETEMIGSSPGMVEIYKTISRGRAHQRRRPDSRRDRNGQGDDRAHDPRQLAARAASPSSRWIAPPWPPRCSKASSSAP